MISIRCAGEEHVKKLFVFLLVLLILAAGVPWALYALGRSNMSAPPEPPTANYRFSPSEERAVWSARDEIFPPSLRPVTPWHFYHLLWCSQDDQDLEDFLTCGDQYPGLRSAAYAAKYHLRDHIERDGLIWRYLARTALAIWISRNWTKDQLVAYLVQLQRIGYVGD
jgi:hypothetical protein